MSTEPQACTKCGSLPEDILMLACSHDLCLDCAAQRFAFEKRKRPPAKGIVCEMCNELTQLDVDSIYELEKIVKDMQRRDNKDLKEPIKNAESRRLQSKYDRPAHTPLDSKGLSSYSELPHGSKAPLTPSAYYEPARKNCQEHPDEELLYYCFECNVECICPECVIHGKHKNHDVKTLKKSQPIIKGKLENLLESIHTNVDGLTGKKSDFEKHIKDVTEANNQNKKQVQRAFNDLRQKIAAKENEILAKCDIALEMTVEEYDRGIKAIVRKMDEIRQSSQNITETLRRDELTLLNFYAKNRTALEQIVKKVDLGGFVRGDARKILQPEPTLKQLGTLNDELAALDIDSSIKYDAKYDPQRSLKANDREYDAELEYQRPARDVDKPRDYLRKY